MFDLLFIILIFGPFPIVCLTRSGEGYKVFGFVVAFISAYGIVGATGQSWLAVIFIPIFWWFSLAPLFEKKEEIIKLSGL